MPRHELTLDEKIRGWRNALKNPRTPAGFKRWIRKQLEEYGR